LRTALLAARKDRDVARVSALRSALSAIDNAETPDGVRLDAPSSGKIAGGVVGLGAAEVERRELSDAQIRELLRAEIDERVTAAQQAAGGGHGERATFCAPRRQCSPPCWAMSDTRARLSRCSSLMSPPRPPR
jgi:hypothetical protein